MLEARIPTPENHDNSHFSVKFFTPDLLYRSVTSDIKNGLGYIAVPLHEADYSSGVLSRVESQLEGERTWQGFMYTIQTHLYLSPNLQSTYSANSGSQLNRIVAYLTEGGTQVSDLEDTELVDTHNKTDGIVIEKDGVYALINFDTAQTDDPEEVPISHKKASVTLVNKAGKNIAFPDECVFFAQAEGYVALLDSVMTALYKEQALLPPQEPIVLNNMFYDAAAIKPESQSKRIITNDDLLSNREPLYDNTDQVIAEAVNYKGEYKPELYMTTKRRALWQRFRKPPELVQEYEITYYDETAGILRLTSEVDQANVEYVIADDKPIPTIIRREATDSNYDQLDYGVNIQVWEEKYITEYELRKTVRGDQTTVKATIHITDEPTDTINGSKEMVSVKYDLSSDKGRSVRIGITTKDPSELREGARSRWFSEAQVVVNENLPYLRYETPQMHVRVPFGREFFTQETSPYEYSGYRYAGKVYLRRRNIYSNREISITVKDTKGFDPAAFYETMQSEDFANSIGQLPIEMTEDKNIKPRRTNERREELLQSIEAKIGIAKGLWQAIQKFKPVTHTTSDAELMEEEQQLQALWQNASEQFPKAATIIMAYDEITDEDLEQIDARVRQVLDMYEDDSDQFLSNMQRTITGLIYRRSQLKMLAEKGGEHWLTPAFLDDQLPEQLLSGKKGHIKHAYASGFGVNLVIDHETFDTEYNQVLEMELGGIHWGNTIWTIIDEEPKVGVIEFKEIAMHEEFHAIADALPYREFEDPDILRTVIQRAVKDAYVSERRGVKNRFSPRFKSLEAHLGAFVNVNYEEALAELASTTDRHAPKRSHFFYSHLKLSLLNQLSDKYKPGSRVHLLLQTAIAEIESFGVTLQGLYAKVETEVPERREDLDIAFALFQPTEIRHIARLVDRWTSKPNAKDD